MTVQFPESVPPQIDYTSRDYTAIREDLIARVQESIPDWTGNDPSDFGVALVEAFAYLGDLMSYYIDRAANESSLSTATRRDSVIALARDLGYTPAGYRSSSVLLSVTNTSDSAVTVPAGTIVAATVTEGDNVMSVSFETDTDVTVNAVGSETVTATQGTVTTGDFGFGEFVGNSDGTPDQTYTISSDTVVLETVEVFVYDLINYIPWQRIDQFADYGPLSRVFQAVLTGVNNVEVRFGDSVTGLIPPFGHSIFVRYRKTDGSLGNVPAGSIQEISSVPGLTSTEVAVLAGDLTVTNDSAAYGGSDPESTESIRRNAPLSYRTTYRAVTLEDFQNISLAVSGCGKASAQSSTPSAVVVSVAPYRGFGVAEMRPGYILDGTEWVETAELEDLKARVYAKLNAASLASVQPYVVSPTYIDVYIAVEITVEDDVRQSDARTLVTQSLLSALDYSNVEFGSSVYPSDIVALVSRLGGIAKDVSVTRLNIIGQSSDDVGVVVAQEDEILITGEANISVVVVGGVA